MQQLAERYQRMGEEMGRKYAASAEEYRQHAEDLERAFRDRTQRAFDPHLKEKFKDLNQLDHAKLAREALRLAERQAAARQAQDADREATEHVRERDREEAVRRLMRDHADKVFDEGGRFLREAREREADLKRRLGTGPRKADIEKTEQRIEQLERELNELRTRLQELRQRSDSGPAERKRPRGTLHV
ncbi:MAG: hypothetical protein U1E76_26195 [Planctomycetota bacterium]